MALDLIAGWLAAAMPTDRSCARYEVFDGEVHLKTESGVFGEQWASVAEALAAEFVESLDWKSLEDTWTKAQREGEKWSLWTIDPDLEAEPLSQEEFADAVLFFERHDISPHEELAPDDWTSLERYLGIPVSKKEVDRLMTYWDSRHPDADEDLGIPPPPEPPAPPHIYKVKVYDNFHYQDEDATKIIDYDFTTAEEALECCQWLVLNSVASNGYDMEAYRSFGADPIILTPPGAPKAPPFSAWTYAQELCDAHKSNQADES